MLPQTTWVVVIRSRRVRLEKSSMRDVDFRAKVDAAASNRHADVFERQIRIRAASSHDVAAAALDEGVEARVVEVASVGQVAIRADLPGIRQRLAEDVEGPQPRVRLAPAAPGRRGAQKPRRTLKSDRNKASAALGVFDPMFGLTAAPETAVAVASDSWPSMYSAVHR